MLRLSHAHLCSEHFAECDFVILWRNTKWGLLQSGICRGVHKVTDLEKIPVRISKDEAADEQQSQSNTNAYGRKGRERKRMYTNACDKERKNKPEMPVTKKERPNHKCWWQTKNGCPNQASKQLTPDERNKQLKPPQNSQRLPTCKHKVGEGGGGGGTNKNTTKSQQSNRLLSATKAWTTTVIRAQSKNKCANDKQMESQTNHN